MERSDQTRFGKYAQHEVDPPRQKIFADLRSMYMQTFGTSSRETAEFLEISAQSCSTLASGSDKRQPRWCLIFRLLEVLGLELVMRSDSINIVRFLDEDEWAARKELHEEWLAEKEEAALARKSKAKALGASDKIADVAEEDKEAYELLCKLETHLASKG